METAALGGEIHLPLLLDAFPEVDLAFAYGSGAVKQGSYEYAKDKSGDDSITTPPVANTKELPMLDLIFSVSDAEAWHHENKKRYSHHYTSVVDLKPAQIAWMQRSIGARVWFNAMVPMPAVIGGGNRLLKYGVVETKDLERDLLEWEMLYVAGRLHKPVHMLKSSPELEACMNRNREFAVTTALSLLPSRFSEMDLYMMIASLSYTGDPRMALGENPEKVRNLVEPIVPAYREWYRNALAQVDPGILRSVEVAGKRTFVINSSADARLHLHNSLPRSIGKLLPVMGGARRHSHAPLASTHDIRDALSTVVARSATSQSMKGLFTVGAQKGVIYAAQKVLKRFK